MKKFLVLVSVVVMLFTLCTITAFATSTEETTVTTEEELTEALTTGGNVKLGSDIDVATSIVIPQNVTVVLDLNGYDIIGGYDGASTTKHIYVIKNYGAFTVNDSTGDGTIVSRGVYNYGTMVLNSGEIVACDLTGGYAVNNEPGSTFTMYGGVLSTSQSGSGSAATPIDAAGTTTLYGGKIVNIAYGTFAISMSNGTLVVPANSTIEVEGAHGAITVMNGTATVYAGKFTCTGVSAQTDNVVAVSGGSLTIYGGEFVADNEHATGGTCVYDSIGTVVIEGGSFSNSSGGDVWGTEGTTINGGTFENLIETSHVSTGAVITNNGETVVKNEDGSFVSAGVAKIGNTSYETLAEAIEAANAGDTVTLLKDVTLSDILTINKSITLDGNGKTLTSSAARAINVENANGVTIKNITIVASGERAINIIKNSTNVTVENATIGAGNYAINVASSAQGAVVAINNSNLKGLNVVNVAASGADVTVTGGKIVCGIENNVENYAALVLFPGIEGAKITANGVEFEILGTSSLTSNSSVDGQIIVNGTEEASNMVAIISYGNTAYSFEKLEEAVAFALNGETVTLLKDVTLSELIKIEKAITLDLNGKKVTATSKKAFEVYADATIKNGTIESASRCVDTRTNVELTLEDLTLVSDKHNSFGNPQPLTIGGSNNGTVVVMNNVSIKGGYTGYAIITFVETELTATNCDISGYTALYVKEGSEGSIFNFVDTKLTSDISNNDVAGNSISAIFIQTNDITVNLDDSSSIDAVGNNTGAFGLSENTQNNTVNSSATLSGNILLTNSIESNTVVVPAEYADKLASEGFVVKTNENGTISPSKKSIKLEDVFTFLGYSINSEGDGITAGFILDTELYAEYCEQNNVTPELGMAFGVNELSVYESYSSFGVAKRYNATINGLKEEHYELELVMAIYVSVDDEKRFITGLNGTTLVVDASSVESVTYKSLKGAN